MKEKADGGGKMSPKKNVASMPKRIPTADLY